MFAMSRSDLAPAYNCGTYHRRGTAGCTSHHIRADRLDELMRLYIRRVMESSASMIERLNQDLAVEQENVAETEQSADHLASVLNDLHEELKATKRQRIRDIMKHPDQEALLEETYDEMESDLQRRIEGLTHQIDLLSDRRNTILRVNRVAKTAIDVFGDILAKEKLDRNDLRLIIDHIRVYEDHLEIQLQADIDQLLRSCELEDTVNFKAGIENALGCRLVQSARNQRDKVFDAHVVNGGGRLPNACSRMYPSQDRGRAAPERRPRLWARELHISPDTYLRWARGQ